MKKLWDRQIRPAILLCSFIIFVFLVIGQDSSGRRHQHSGRIDLRPSSNSARKRLNLDEHRGDRRDHSGGKSGSARELLEVGEHELTGEKVDDTPQISQQSNSGGDLGQQPNLPSQNATVLIPVKPSDESVCANVRRHPGYADACSFVKAIPECSSGTLIEYTHLFYCFFSGNPVVAYTALTFWLVSLFYMLGNTAADFFCCALQKLSNLLHLAPTVAGVTLLPLGNGAPDVFASIAAFIGAAGQGQVGLNSVLGGATFVSSVVAGSVSLAIAGAATVAPVQLDRSCFLRDTGFFLFTLACLTAILRIGKINFWGSVGYISIYALYAFTVAAVEILRSYRHKYPSTRALQPLLSGTYVFRRVNFYLVSLRCAIFICKYYVFAMHGWMT